MRTLLITLLASAMNCAVAQVQLGNVKWVNDTNLLQVLNDTLIYASAYTPEPTRYTLSGDTLKIVITKFEVRNDDRFDPRSTVFKSLHVRHVGKDSLRVGDEILVNSKIRYRSIHRFAFLSCEREAYLTNGYSTDTAGKIIEADTVFTIQGIYWKKRKVTVFSKMRRKHVEGGITAVADSTMETKTVKLSRTSYKELKHSLGEVLWTVRGHKGGSYQYRAIISGEVNGERIEMSTGFLHPMLNDYFVLLESLVR